MIRKNTRAMLIGNVCRLGIQAAYFLLIARNLGSKQYGAFVAITSATSLLFPFVANGCGRVMIRSVARDPLAVREYFGKALVRTFVTGWVLGAVGLALSLALFHGVIGTQTIVVIVASDFLAFRFTELASYVFQAHDELRMTSAISVGTTAMRLLGIVAVVALHTPSLFAYSVAYLVTSVIASAIALSAAISRFGRPALSFDFRWSQLKDGTLFSAGVVAETIYNDIDKSMLARLGDLQSAGIYAAASRIIEVAFVPVRSILASTYSSFFRAGRNGVGSTLEFCRKYLTWAALYTVVAAIGLVTIAPMVSRVLGPGFAATSEAIRWMALVLVVRAVHGFGADVLAGADYQGVRTAIQGVVAIFNVAVNLYLIRVYSWVGAAWSTVASEALLAVLLWTAVVVLVRNEASVRSAMPASVPTGAAE